MKAFIASILAITMCVILITFWSAIAGASVDFERSISSTTPLSYASSLFDSVGNDVNILIGPNATIVKNNQTIVFSVNEQLPKSNFSATLSAYNTFLQNNITGVSHTNVSLNFSNVIDGAVAVTIFGNLQYLLNYTNSSSNEVLFQGLNSSSKTNVTVYNISISVSKFRQSISPFSFDPSGDISVLLKYTDYNGTDTQTGNLSSTVANSFSIKYVNNETVTILLGKSGNREGILFITDNLASPIIDINVSLPLQDIEKKASMVYNIPMNYSQGKIFKNAQIEK
ncbi:MAG: hypothetical protein Q7S22_00590 [Candidatus Micrarchaeota archaeon]|nr:hypothetical protein [Candidatus Micrarchaeota archaeon]